MAGNVRERALALYAARRDRRPIEPFTDDEPTLGMAQGYEIQQALVGLLEDDGDRVIGHKVGATSLAMQRLIGLDSPDYGPVLESTLYRDGEPVSTSRFISPKLEAEISFVLGSRLVGPGVTYEEARQSVLGLKASIEIVDSRIAQWRIRLADTIADLASNGAIVLSDDLVEPDGIDIRAIRMVLTKDGREVASGMGADALGDPVAVLVWLSNTLGDNGVPLEAGHIVMTGALHAAVPMAPGDVFRAEFDHLGAVELAVTE